MNEGDSLALGASARLGIDQPYAGCPAFLESLVEIVNREADVMYAGAAPLDKSADRSVDVLRLEQLDQGFACLERNYPGAVRVRDFCPFKSEYVPVEWQRCVDGGQGDANMRDSGSLWGAGLH